MFRLIVFALPGSFGLFLTSYAGLLVMLSLTDLLLNAGLGAVSLESAQGTVQRLVILNDYVRHRSHLTSLQLLICAQYNCLGIPSTVMIITTKLSFVNWFFSQKTTFS